MQPLTGNQCSAVGRLIKRALKDGGWAIHGEDTPFGYEPYGLVEVTSREITITFWVRVNGARSLVFLTTPARTPEDGERDWIAQVALRAIHEVKARIPRVV